MSELVTRAEEWLAQDPDPETREELRRILDAGDAVALEDRFGARLEFGTAGLRGELGAGPNRMNRVTVMRAAAGLARRLGPGRHVVIGYDARHNSDVFARDSAAVLTGAGLRVSLMAHHWPTPVLAFAVRHLGADAGVMVTASHNPPRDNGYKVYWGDGAQIVPPLDVEISAAIEETGPVDRLPLGTGWETLDDAAIVEPYLAAVTALPIGDARDLRVAYTPMHGVGGEILLRAFAAAGFAPPAVVEAQFTPDPDFPTVSFPNPEEPGAMDLALRLAEKTGADLLIANDPDADRCAVGVPTPDGGFRMLTGDETGGLLGEWVIERTSAPDRLVAASIVSSSLLGKIARAHGVRHAETLTGFKWIVKAGDGLVYGYEEALGHSVGSDRGLPVRDKDGIGAALTIAGMAAAAKRDGRTLLDLLDAQAGRYGLHATAQLSFRVSDLALITAAMERLRSNPPQALGGRGVHEVDDLSAGVDDLPPTDGLRYRLDGDARVVVRPSGTEPKLKCYLEVVVPVTGGDVPAARTRAASDLAAVKTDLAAALGL
ncbi:phosphomannomutase [Sphaerisporangium melleum]|uniref:Phosphomannomutase n=1 Tax=Sphaerisporangium melleum TaxID=321316 RepID=A0A917QSF0_9ACTN|nr:phospho-sugar mutase [Sphaerisporangium melleum]GGK65969.1 phosphomannomutase [Sphaerisporangium melleum]GII69890.1 phosphomannomutase [Sphaerisporangium melleum]